MTLLHLSSQVRFQIPKPLRFTAKLKTNEQDEKALAQYILYRVVVDQAVFTVTAPKRGEYGLEVYANDPVVDGNALFHAYQYLVICTEAPPSPVQPLPELPPGYLGPQPAMAGAGLVPASHPDPYVQLPAAAVPGGALEVAFSLQQPVRLTSQLLSARSGEDVSDFVLQQAPSTELVVLLVRPPAPGLYKLQLYALPYADSSESLPGAFNYLLNVHPPASPSPAVVFPRQYGQWKEGCFLHAPQDGVLTRSSAGDSVTFSLVVPSANSVAVVVGEDWTQLDQKTGSGGAWEGVVPLAPHWGKEDKLAVCANYGSVKASYSTLLEYQLRG